MPLPRTPLRSPIRPTPPSPAPASHGVTRRRLVGALAATTLGAGALAAVQMAWSEDGLEPPSLHRLREQTTLQAALILQAWIENARARALAQGASPVPPAMRRLLRGFFADVLLDSVRFRVGLVSGGDLPAMMLHAFDTRAVALVDVIVFRERPLATQAMLWAHELAHVRQFRDWGVAGFSRRYVSDHQAVEREAWDMAVAWKTQALQRGLIS